MLATTVERFREPLESVVDELIHLPIPRRLQPLKDFQAAAGLVRLMRELKPDVVHSHTSKAGFLARLAGRIAGVPLVLHTIHELPQNAARSALTRRFYWLLEWIAAHWADHLVTVSYTNERQILAERICPPAKLTTIREGLVLEEYVPKRPAAEVRAEWGVPPGAPLIGMAARMEAGKGYTYLLQAFARLPEHVWLACIGRGELQDTLRAEARALGVADRVVFTGWVEDLVSAMNALDLFVLSSLYEGLGIVLLEAMALGKAVVSSRVGGTQDVVVEGETGLFVPPRDPEALAAAMRKLLDDPDLRSRMGTAGRSRVEREFRSERADAEMLALYERLAVRRREAL